jgi:hypothetical protein
MPLQTYPKRYALFGKLTRFDFGGPGGSCKIGSIYPQDLHGYFNADDWVDKGGPVPGYRQRIAAGASATSSLLGVRHAIKLGSVGYSDEPKPSSPYFSSIRCSKSIYSGHIFECGPAPIPPQGATSEAEYKAASNLLQSYISAQTKFRGGNAIAEFAETVRMLANPLKSVYSHTWSFVGKVGKLKKVYRRDPVRYGRLLGGAWLAYSFGLKPLMSDVADAESAVSHLANDLSSFDTIKIRGSGLQVLDVPSFRQVGIPISHASHARCDRDARAEYSVRYVGAIRAKPPGYSAVLSNFGVGFEDILPAVWEGIPWSFLVDYFVNVGEVLDSLRLANADLGWLKKTTRNRNLRRWSSPYKADNISTQRDYDVSVTGSGGMSSCVRVTRTAIHAMPYPGFRFRIPGSPEKFANIAALTAAISASKPR